MRVCNACGNTKEFKGYQEYKEWGTEGITVDGDDEIIDYSDRDSTDSESGDRTIESCNKCSSKEIEWLEGKKLEDWHINNFNENGDFKRNTKMPSKSPGQFSSIEKLGLLNDQLLKNEITIGEYRQRVQEARKEA